MSDIVSIIYNGADAFAPQPTPFISVEETSLYYGEYWGKRETVTLQGQITGCTFVNIVAAQTNILSAFNKSYQPLQIWQTQAGVSGLVYQKDLTEVQSITFPSDRMIGVSPYAITLVCYPSGYFSGAFGILEPRDTWEYVEQPNESLAVTHTISCRPFNTSLGPNNALVNARTWAFARSGVSTTIFPVLISGVSPSNFIIVEAREDIDRFNGTYSLIETYTNDLARTGYGVIRYSAEVQSGNNLVTVSLNGTADGGGRNISGLRAAFARLDKTAIALKSYQNAFNLTDLNPVPLSQSFTEDPFTTRIDFSYAFNNDNSPPVAFDYTVDLSTALNGLITAALKGTVRVRGGNLTDKIAQSRAYLATVSPLGLIQPFYAPFDVSSFIPLNPIPVSSGQSINYSDGSVSLDVTFNNQDKVSLVLDIFNFSMAFQPSVEKSDIKPKLNGLGNYSIVDLGYANRASLTINGDCVVGRAFTAAAGVVAVKQACFDIFAQYGRFSNTTLDQEQINTTRTDDRALSFTFAWSFDSPNKVGLTTVNSLAV